MITATPVKLIHDAVDKIEHQANLEKNSVITEKSYDLLSPYLQGIVDMLVVEGHTDSKMHVKTNVFIDRIRGDLERKLPKSYITGKVVPEELSVITTEYFPNPCEGDDDKKAGHKDLSEEVMIAKELSKETKKVISSPPLCELSNKEAKDAIVKMMTTTMGLPLVPKFHGEVLWRKDFTLQVYGLITDMVLKQLTGDFSTMADTTTIKDKTATLSDAADLAKQYATWSKAECINNKAAARREDKKYNDANPDKPKARGGCSNCNGGMGGCGKRLEGTKTSIIHTALKNAWKRDKSMTPQNALKLANELVEVQNIKSARLHKLRRIENAVGYSVGKYTVGKYNENITAQQVLEMVREKIDDIDIKDIEIAVSSNKEMPAYKVVRMALTIIEGSPKVPKQSGWVETRDSGKLPDAENVAPVDGSGA